MGEVQIYESRARAGFCLEPPRAMGLDNEQRSKMGDAMPTN